MNLTVIYLLMILCHLLADYPLQGWLAQAKQKSWWEKNVPDEKYKYDYVMALSCHATMWGIMIYLPFMFFGEIDFCGWVELLFWLTLPLNIILHIGIDNLKANRHKINLIVDQFLHLMQISITFMFYLLLLILF